MVFYRRRLPHWQPDGKALFVTWRLHGSLPAGVQTPKNSRWVGARDSMNDFLSDDFLSVDSLLDRANLGPTWLKDPAMACMVDRSLHHGQEKLRLYTLWAYVVMSNHVHVLLTPGVALEQITRVLKGYTAREANKTLKRTGMRFWQEESFDHWMRDEEEFSRTVEYIENNPVAAGLVKRKEDWPWSSAHR
jgi:putative transposase